MSEPDDIEVYTPAAAVRVMEEHIRELWAMLDSEGCPFDAPMRRSRGERLKALLLESHEMTGRILRRYFEEGHPK